MILIHIINSVDKTKLSNKFFDISFLRLQYTFRSAIFFKFGFFGLSNDPNEISNVKKKSLKKIEYWQRNGGLKFWSEVTITRLIDTFSAVFANQFFHLKRTLKS